MSGPNAFSIRRAISGVSEALPGTRSESVARRTFRMSVAFDRLRPSCFDDFGFDQVARIGRILRSSFRRRGKVQFRMHEQFGGN